MLFLRLVVLPAAAESSRSSRSQHGENEIDVGETLRVYAVRNLRVDDGETTSHDRTGDGEDEESSAQRNHLDQRDQRIEFQLGESIVCLIRLEVIAKCKSEGKDRRLTCMTNIEPSDLTSEFVLGNDGDGREKGDGRRVISNRRRTVGCDDGRIFSLFSIAGESTVCAQRNGSDSVAGKSIEEKILSVRAKFVRLQCFSSVLLRRKFIYQIVLERSFHTAGIDISYEQRGKALIAHVINGSEGERLGKSINGRAARPSTLARV